MAMKLPSEFLRYLAARGGKPGERLPPIPELAKHLGISTGKLREQLEVARTLGLVEVKPKSGMRCLAYSFLPAARTSLLYALAVDPANFEHFGVLRNHIEAGFWEEAVRLLGPDEKQHLQDLMARAWAKLRGDPIQIPHQEHRELHQTIFSRLENPFVRALLEAYWEGYEAAGLNTYADYAYLHKVWTYHQTMVDAILEQDVQTGYRALVEHSGLLQNRPELARLRPPEPITDAAG